MTDDHHTPEGADGRDKQSFIQLLDILNTSLDNRIPNKLMNRLLAWRNEYVAAEVHASNRRLLEGLKPDGRNLSTSAYGLWVQAAIDAELERLGRGEA